MGKNNSQSWRQILQRYHRAKVGRYSYGDILRPGLLPPGSRVGAYCSVGTALDRPVLHPLFYNAALGFLTRDTIAAGTGNPLTIGHDVWIGDRVTIPAGCRSIGNGAVIAGVPARVLRMRFDAATIAALQASRWWDRPLPEMIAAPPVKGLLG